MSKRKIRIYSRKNTIGLDPCHPCINAEIDDENATELWIDSTELYSMVDFDHISFGQIKKICFYDFFHAHIFLDPIILDNIRKISEMYPTIWYTCNAKPISDINCQRFDFLWNRTKMATLEGRTGWKQICDPRPYQRTGLHWEPRSKKYLSLNRTLTKYRQRLVSFLEEQQLEGYLGNLTKNKIIGNKFVKNDDIMVGTGIPPSAEFFDDSYISCQVESQYEGTNSVIFTEKTYDHLVRGRIVLNFGPQGYYQCLANDGWLLPEGIDLSWDSEPNTEQRFQGYINMLSDLLNRPLFDLHDWFLSNRSMIEHNYQMLETKPYDTID